MELYSDKIFSVESYLEQAAKTGAELKTIGFSLQKRPIVVLKKGTGKLKALFIARLHGNEPAPTQAVIDFFHDYSDEEIEAYGIFLANPDGAALYEQNWQKNRKAHWKNIFQKARLNSVEVDLNRDWMNLTQQETRIIRQFIFSLKPDLVVDHHEFYWKKEYPPKFPTQDEDGFLATMTDSPFYLAHPYVKEISEKLMGYLIEESEREFQWKIKPRHFIGDSHDTFENPGYLGIYLALRGIPKLLVETWGVACSMLLLPKRVEFHRRAMEHVIDWMKRNESCFVEKPSNLQYLKFNLQEAERKKIEQFRQILVLHGIEFEQKGQEILIQVPLIESGYIKTIYYFIFQKED